MPPLVQLPRSAQLRRVAPTTSMLRFERAKHGQAASQLPRLPVQLQQSARPQRVQQQLPPSGRLRRVASTMLMPPCELGKRGLAAKLRP